MTFYLGTKAVLATPMNRLTYNLYRGWDLPDDENPLDAGYLIEDNAGAANHPEHKGFIQWLPAAEFERTYRSSGSFSFGHAVELLKTGHKVARSGWNGKGMWLVLIEPGVPKRRDPLAQEGHVMMPGTIKDLPWIGMKTADDCFVPWLASQTDVLAEDWCLVD